MKKNEQIITKFTSNFETLFQNVPKYSVFLNALLSKESDSEFYLELINDGILYIYNNFATFRLMNVQYTLQQLLDFEEIHGLSFEPKQFLEDILTPSTYPKDGIEFRFNFYVAPENLEEAKSTVLGQYKSVLQEKVEVIKKPDFDLVLLIKKYEGIILYLKMISLMLNGLLNKSR